MASMDKSIKFSTATITTGADTNMKLGQVTLFDNGTGEVNKTMDRVLCEIDWIQGTTCTINKFAYAALFVTDPGGSLPTGSDGVDLASFNTWLNSYRKNIWGTIGGMIDKDMVTPKRFILEPNTKRALVPGQKLILALWVANESGAAAESLRAVWDVNLFYHY